MIILLGASGYVGQAFQRTLEERGETFLPVSRQTVDYTRYGPLVALLKDAQATFLINAAGYTGQPNVDACETARADTLAGNVALPITVSHACQATGTPWGHVSSGCIYTGAWIRDDGGRRLEKDLMQPEVRHQIDARPECVEGFAEEDLPNFSFRDEPCSFYSGTKALGEEVIADDPHLFIWRLRIPFDHLDQPRNYITKLLRYPKAYDNFNSLSHLGDFVNACLQLWELRAPFSIYNMTNPGYVSTREVIARISATIAPQRCFSFWESDEAFYRDAAQALRSNCVLDVSKLLDTGVKMPYVQDALDRALSLWQMSSVAENAIREPHIVTRTVS